MDECPRSAIYEPRFQVQKNKLLVDDVISLMMLFPKYSVLTEKLKYWILDTGKHWK